MRRQVSSDARWFGLPCAPTSECSCTKGETEMRRSHLTRRAIVAGVVSLGLIASACGGDDDGDTTTVPATDAPAETTAPDDGGDAGATVAWPGPRRRLPPGRDRAAVQRAGVRGTRRRSVFYVQCSVPVCAEIAIGIEAAAAAIGWEYQTARTRTRPTRWPRRSTPPSPPSPTWCSPAATRASGSPISSTTLESRASRWSPGRCPRATSPATASRSTCSPTTTTTSTAC
jgi:hypothetical protein